MYKIGIVGYGFVGKAVEYGFKQGNKIFIYDKFLPSLSLEEVVKKSEVIFVGVPTPMTKAYKKIDLSIIEDVTARVVKLALRNKVKPIIVLKSTIVPGTTRRLIKTLKYPRMVFNPEFLTEANYLQDFVNADRVVIGADNNEVKQWVVDLYRATFPKIPIFETDPTTAEVVKYVANTYLAMKVIFANEIYDLCEKLGVNYGEMKKMVVADERIYDSHLDITAQRGFGGKCFPKDSVALLGLARELGVELSVVRAAWKKNLRIRKVRDWENIEGAVSKK
ncbi:UDP-glucose/GDP-mannose dehydrogenase family protein [Patescibacteria group bacterium]|nr:UDP-glucose/GDP-mannose dehydrogenase family protein [Patescibacteria group bacterium]